MAQLSKKNFVKSQKVQDTFKPPILTKENIEKVLGVSVTPSSSNKPSSKTSSISSKSKNNSIKRVLSIELSFEEPNPQSNYSDISYRMNEPADNFDYLNFVKNLSHGTIMNDTIYSTPLVDRYDESEDIFTPSETPVQNDEIKVFSQNEKEKASEDSGFPLSQEILNSKEPRRKKDKKVKQNLVNKNASKENDDESDENSTLPLHEKMLLIQESRNVGLYCLCDSCDKARYLPDIKDPLDLPTKWYCSMNPDPNHNKCSDPEEVLEDEEFLIENLFNTGSIVWAKMDGYPWWPAMVEDDPITEEYFWFEKEDADSKPSRCKERHMSIDSARDSGIGENSNFTEDNKYDDPEEQNGSGDSFSLEICNEPSTSCVATSESHTDLRGYWQPKVKKSLADRLPTNSFHLVPPSRYVFPGAEVFYDPDEKQPFEEEEEGDSSSSSSSSSSASSDRESGGE